MAQGPIKNCTIDLRETYLNSDYGRDTEKEYFIDIEIKLPGGKAVYSVKIDKQMSESMKFAQQLSEKK